MTKKKKVQKDKQYKTHKKNVMQLTSTGLKINNV
jgi:hypothetical protein